MSKENSRAYSWSSSSGALCKIDPISVGQKADRNSLKMRLIHRNMTVDLASRSDLMLLRTASSLMSMQLSSPKDMSLAKSLWSKSSVSSI